VYVAELSKSKKYGTCVPYMQSVPNLVNQVLHFWNVEVTYQTLSVK